MTVFFDCRYIRVGHHDGISRFSAGLFREAAKLIELTAIISDERQLEKLPLGTKFVKFNDPTSPAEPFLALKLNKLGAQKVFSPMQTMGSIFRKYKLVLTLHDLIYYRHPAPPPEFNIFIRILWRLYHLSFFPVRLFLNRADRVVTVSETTKSLMQANRLTRKPIDVIYNAADEMAGIGMPSAKSRKLIYMGSFMDYKNVEFLIDAMAYLPEFELRLLSRIAPLRQKEFEKRISAASGRVTFVNGVTDAEYRREIIDAFCLVHASKDEGFGIPLVEAMAASLPVVVSRIPIFEEIGGAVAQYFEEGHPEQFINAIRRLEDYDFWRKKSLDSLERSKKFSWAISAKKLVEVITNL